MIVFIPLAGMLIGAILPVLVFRLDSRSSAIWVQFATILPVLAMATVAGVILTAAVVLIVYWLLAANISI